MSASSKAAVNQKVEPSPSWLFDADGPPHHLHQLLADRQPEPGAAVLARGGGVRLDERREQRAAWSGRIPIPVSETVKRTVAVRVALAFECRFQSDLARSR